MPLDGPQLAEQGTVFNKNFFEDFKVSEGFPSRGFMSTLDGDAVGKAWQAPTRGGKPPAFVRYHGFAVTLDNVFGLPRVNPLL